MSETELQGIVNGHRVNDHLYRGGDVSLAGITTLKERGIAKVICLKNAKQDSASEIMIEHAQVVDAGIVWLNVPMDSSGVFSYDDGAKVPGILTEIEQTTGPVFVGCHHGSDRTGVVVACYRIQRDKWTVEEAIAEMKKYGASWIHFGMRAFVKDFASNKEKS